MAMNDAPEASEESEDSNEVSGEVFSDAASSAFELWSEGKKGAAVASLRGAIEACVADYMADD